MFTIRTRRPAIIFFFQAEDGIRDADVTGVQTCALPISPPWWGGRGWWARRRMARLSLPQQHDQDDDHGGEHSGEEHEPVQAAWALVHVSTSSPGLLAGLGLRFAAGYAAAGGLAT